MIRATTPTHKFQFPIGVEFDEILVTYAQNGTIVLEKTKDDMTFDENNCGSYTLSQEETKKFTKGTYELQVRALRGEKAYATKVSYLNVSDVLDDAILGEEVTENED